MVDDLGPPPTPTTLHPRKVNSEHLILAAYPFGSGHQPLGPVSNDGAAGVYLIIDPIVRTLALPRFEATRQVSVSRLPPLFHYGRLGTLSEGLRTPSSAQRQHALLGYYWRNSRCGPCANSIATQSKTRLRVANRIGRRALRPPPLLRTVRESFPSYGSSTPKAVSVRKRPAAIHRTGFKHNSSDCYLASCRAALCRGIRASRFPGLEVPVIRRVVGIGSSFDLFVAYNRDA